MKNPQKETHCKQNAPSRRRKSPSAHDFHKFDKNIVFLPNISAYLEKIYRDKRFLMRKFTILLPAKSNRIPAQSENAVWQTCNAAPGAALSIRQCLCVP
ncbi:MAG: hypothetical protein Q4A06_00400 [Cardiobacteriaceae bacterium]|nr:hypothetical protein [Cardiobacteriaceae bacterium]